MTGFREIRFDSWIQFKHYSEMRQTSMRMRLNKFESNELFSYKLRLNMKLIKKILRSVLASTIVLCIFKKKKNVYSNCGQPDFSEIGIIKKERDEFMNKMKFLHFPFNIPSTNHVACSMTKLHLFCESTVIITILSPKVLYWCGDNLDGRDFENITKKRFIFCWKLEFLDWPWRWINNWNFCWISN